MARLLIALVIGLLVALSTPGASARPCRTFLISSYTFSLPSSDDPSLPSTATLTSVTEIHTIRSFPAKLFFKRAIRDSAVVVTEARRSSPRTRPAATLGFPAEEFDSLRERTKDLIVFFAALLFVVGCGTPRTSSGPCSPAATITVTTITLTRRKMRRSIALRS
ncbi:hypothetical protein PIB30_107765 [Stylosanthes scabra]|uniref:Uncharacterized protein n=1 Tax=Stylosanthes scabra TaxID=79078 RepID=A0ABU6V1X0_9FABA|nr:hypothetical protein [Stylosanthes scabra]